MCNVTLDFGLKSFLMVSLSGKFQSFLFPYPNRHGIRRPDEAFFHHNPKLLGLGRQIEQILGAFEADFLISTHFGTLSPLSMFPINQPLF